MMGARTDRFVEMAGTSFGIVGLLSIGFVTGWDIWSFGIDPVSDSLDILEGGLHVNVFEGGLYVTLFGIGIAATAALLGYDLWFRDSSKPPLHNGPQVQAIVPAYRDANIVDESVTSLLANDYGPLDVVIVVEPNDDATRKRARELAATYDRVSSLVNDTPGSKATAINTAVRRSEADYFVVFDADERASPAFVSTAMGQLTRGADVFQGRRVPRPSGPVETLAYCERIVVQAGYFVGDLAGFTHCQSSATGFTREAFETVGGFADVLTEDIYFSHQVHRAGLQVVADRGCTSSMEAPHTLSDLWGQRKRWRIGHVQVCKNRLQEVLFGPSDRTDIVAIARALGAVLAGSILLVLAAQVLMLLVYNPIPVLFTFGCLLGLIGIVWSRDAVEGRVGVPSWTVALAPLVFLGHGILTVKAITEYALTWEGEWYQVTKTGV